MKRRNFVNSLGVLVPISVLTENYLNKFNRTYENSNSTDYWDGIKSNFAIANRPDGFIHLNSGSVGTMSVSTMVAMQELINYMNDHPPYEALNSWKSQREAVRAQLSELLDCGADEINITRNSTEGLNTIISGIPLIKDDEFLAASHDYPHSLFAIHNRVARDEIKSNIITVDLFAREQEIVQQYIDAFTPRTKVVLITHITHRQGFVMPVRKIADEAHKRGILVMVDAAHSVGQVEHSIKELGADYYVSSLHKWLNAPHSTGLLYVTKELIPTLQPLMACDPNVADRIVKFEYLGTRTFHQEVGILFAIEELKAMGLKRKEERLRELSQYWHEQAKRIPGFKSLTPLKENKFAAVTTFIIEGVGASLIRNRLKKEFNIQTKSVGTKPKTGLRISTNVYHLKSDLDKFVSALEEIVKSERK